MKQEEEIWLQSPTQIIIVLLKENEDHALYLINEALERAGIAILDQHEVQKEFGTIIFRFRTEKQILFALSKAPTPEVIEDITHLTIIGLILGCVVRGEINLGGKTICNLAKEKEHRR